MKIRSLLLAVFLAAFVAGTAPAHAETNVLFIFDSSGSMKKKVDNGEARMTVAKRVMAQTLKEMPAGVRVGLLLYGHRRAKDCTDIELASPIGADDAPTIARRITGLKPKGETPIAAALEQAIRSFAALKGQSNRVVLAHLSEQAVLDQARFLRIAAGKTILAFTDEERTLVVDLAIHAPRYARSRTFERYRNAVKLPADSDEARVLDALCAARFVIGAIEGRHDVAGLVVTDLLRSAELWLMDVNLEASLSEPFSFAGHLITLDGFWMTTGAIAPVERADVEDALDHLPPARAGTPEAVADDPLFAGLVCRAALARGAMDEIMMA